MIWTIAVVLLLFSGRAVAGWWPFGSRMPPAPSCEPSVLPLDVRLEVDPKLVQEGQEYFLTYHSKSRQNECWSNAFISINEACSNMHTSLQQELALKFADCFMRDSGRQLHPCVASNRPAAICLQQLDAAGFAVYTEFFTHLESMCHYIQAEVWQRSAEATIHALSRNSAQAANTLMKTHSLQETLLDQQQQQLNGYKALHEHQTALEAEIAQSAREIDDKVRQRSGNSHCDVKLISLPRAHTLSCAAANTRNFCQFEGLMKTAHQLSSDLVAQASSLDQILDFKALYSEGQLEVLERLRAASEDLDGYVSRVEEMLAQAQQSHDHMQASIGYVERIVSGVSSMWSAVCISVTLALWLNIIIVCTSTPTTASARTGLILLWFCMLLSEGCDQLLHIHTPHTKARTQHALLALGCAWFAAQALRSCCRRHPTPKSPSSGQNNDARGGLFGLQEHDTTIATTATSTTGTAATNANAASFASSRAGALSIRSPRRATSNLCTTSRRKLQILAKLHGISTILSPDALLEALGQRS